MKLLDVWASDDFGKEWCISILQFKRKSFIQGSFGIFDCNDVYLQMSMGINGLFSSFITLGKFSICLDLFTSNWSRN